MAIQTELPLVSTIAVGLGMAFLCGLAAARLRISPIVGYLLAGIIIGPYTPGFMADMDLAHQLSEIGIVLLMFGVGLHFSMDDLLAVRKIAVTGALLRIILVTAIGMTLSSLWGWTRESGIMMGLAISVASTVVLLRALEEQNLQQSIDGRIAIGWLIVEDIVMILALVLVPVLGQAGEDGGSDVIVRELLIAIGKVAVFVTVMEVAGRRLLPMLLTAVAGTRSRELFTLAVFATAVGVAFGAANLFDVSLALGAFFAGMIISESHLHHEVAARALPFQDAFAVLFFVSVGMLFNPAIVMTQPLQVLTIAGIIIAGKFFITLALVSLFGYTLKTGLSVSAGLAQIGEFSFILVTLGVANGLLPPEGRDLILAGALLSIALNPLAFYFSRRLYGFVERRPRLSEKFNMRDDDLAHLSGGQKHVLKDLVILVGHGRAGRQISENIQNAHIDLVVIDANRERVEELRKNGFHAIAGDAGHPQTLEDAAIHKAVAIAVAVPDSFEARRIVEAARALKPSIRILVRAYNSEELEHYKKQNIDLPLLGAKEVGRRMVEYLNEMKNQQGRSRPAQH